MGHMNIILNHHREKHRSIFPAPPELLPEDQMLSALTTLRAWPGYEPTPTVAWPGFAAHLDLAGVHVKDESERFGLGSFKALGGALAVYDYARREVAGRTGEQASLEQILSGAHTEVVRGLTVATATDGNHGRSVAWGASLVGCACKVYMPNSVSMGRQRAVEAFGAEVVRTDTNFDACFDRVVKDADQHGWQVISDTSTDDYRAVPTLIMQGYRLMVEEALESLDGAKLTHVFVQSGCGGLAGAVAAHLVARYGDRAPRLITVEPEQAACLFASLLCGEQVVVRGSLETVMGGLSVGTISTIAWQILAPTAFAATTVEEAAIVHAMRDAAEGRWGDPPVIAGESGVVGLAAASTAARSADLRRILELREDSQILVFNTEGITDPELYSALMQHGLEGAQLV